MENNQMTVYDENYQIEEFDTSKILSSASNFTGIFMRELDEKLDSIAIYNAMQNPDVKVADMINTPFTITGLMTHPVTLINEKTGEKSSNPRIVIFTGEGKTIESVSVTLFQSICAMVAMCGQPEHWPKGGLKAKITQKKTAKGFNRYALELLK